MGNLIVEAGLWKGAKYIFSFMIPDGYPHTPPKVTLDNKIYHPNIDYDGNVCLNILKAHWRPVLSLEQVIHGLRFLFLEPNPDDPLNHSAAEVLRNNPNKFEQNVARSLQGGQVDEINFERNQGHTF